MKQVKVYGKKDCVQCKFTKKFLDNYKIKYEYIDIEESKNKEDILSHIKDELGYSSLPVVETSDEHFSGYQPTKLKQLIT